MEPSVLVQANKSVYARYTAAKRQSGTELARLAPDVGCIRVVTRLNTQPDTYTGLVYHVDWSRWLKDLPFADASCMTVHVAALANY